MGTLVIKGHPTRGKEVIDILKMFGGNNIKEHCGGSNLLYTIRERDNVIICTYNNSDISQIYTLEEFLEKFPYKIGDKVQYDKTQHKGATSCGSVFEIEKMRWVNNDVEYTVKRLWYNNCYTTFIVKDLQPYKEDMEEKKLNSNASFLDCSMIEKIELALGNTHEVVVEDGKTFVVRKKTQYPKTYEECCEVLGWNQYRYDRTGYCADLLCKL